MNRDPKAGYARDFVELMQEILPDCVEKNIKVLSNAGGVNVEGCAEAIRDVARELGLQGKVKIGVVTGDDVLDRLDEFIANGVEINSMDDGTPLAAIRDKVQSANVYLGAEALVEALGKGANVIVGGRLTDTGLTLAPLMHEFGWSFDDWDKVSAGTIAGHIIECGAQSSGGNCQYDWQNIPDMANIGFPIVEASPNGEFIVTKHEGTGGRVNIQSVKEQLLYEMGDPHEYITPDVVADFASINLEPAGENRVRVFGITGHPKTDFYKVSIAYTGGYKAVGTLVYSWPDAYEKAQAADKILRERLKNLGLEFEVILTEYVGVNATHGHLRLTRTQCPRVPTPVDDGDRWQIASCCTAIADHSSRITSRYSRSPTPHRRPRPNTRRRRTLHQRDRPAHPHRPALRHRLRRRPPQSRRDHGLLPRPDPQIIDRAEG